MDTQRTILLVVLALIVMMLWQKWDEQYGAKPDPKQTASKGVSKKGDKKTASGQTDVPGVPTETKGSGVSRSSSVPRVTTAKALKKGKRIYVETDLIRAWIDVRGGDIRRLELKQYPIELDKPKDYFALLDETTEHTFIAQSGLIGDPKADKFPNHNTLYSSQQTRYVMKNGEKAVHAQLYWRSPRGVRYTKTYTFHRDRYDIDIVYKVENKTGKPWSGHFYGQLLRNEPEGNDDFLRAMPTFTGGAIFTPNEGYEKIKFEILADKNDLNKTLKDAGAKNVIGGWVAMMQHYFVAAWMPKQDRHHQFLGGQRSDELYKIGYTDLQPIKIAAGKTDKIGSRLYVGPKEHKRLSGLQVRGMALTVDFGWLTAISDPLFRVLLWINKAIGNWGWSIIILTILIKLLFYPLSAASYKSMAKMKKLGPKMKSIKERYGQDKERERQAMMELYKTEKINPLGGCLPILIQIPVFIALYWVLLESVELRHADWAFWIKDLSAKDPYFVLPVLMGASMFAQQKMSPTPMDPMQQRIFMMLPIIFTVFFLFFPAGLVLYWLVNNLLTIAQQWYITRNLEKKKA